MAANNGRAGVGRFEPQKKAARVKSKVVVATLSRRATQPEAKKIWVGAIDVSKYLDVEMKESV